MITLEISHRSFQLGLLAALTTGTGFLTVDAFQRFNGFSHPLFLVMGLTTFATALPLYLKCRKEPPPRRPINPLVYLSASLLASVLAIPNLRIALNYADFTTYLHIRAWIFTITGLLSVFFYSAFMLSLIRLTNRKKSV